MSDNYGKDPDAISRLTPEQYRVTQQNGTEPVPTGVRPRPEGPSALPSSACTAERGKGDKGRQQRGVAGHGDLVGEPGIERRLDLGHPPGGLDPAQHVTDRGPVGQVTDPQAGALEEHVLDSVPGKVPADHLLGPPGGPDVSGRRTAAGGSRPGDRPPSAPRRHRSTPRSRSRDDSRSTTQ